VFFESGVIILSIPVLILTFNRPIFLKKRLVEILERDQYQNVIVSVDFHSHEMTTAYEELLSDFIERYPDELRVIYRTTNIGIAKHLPISLDEIFERNDSAIIFEDDVAVGSGVLASFAKANQILKTDESIFTIGGFTFSIWPLARILKNQWRETHYFSAWGWMTNRNQWSNYRQSLSGENLEDLFVNRARGIRLSSHQQRIWLTRFKKCQENENRTWDIPMQYWTFITGKHHLLPTFRLLENEGFNASESTNTRNSRPGWMFKVRFLEDVIEPEYKNSYLGRIMKFIDAFTIGGDRNFDLNEKMLTLLKRMKEVLKSKKY
jgi:hypothetical protein